MGILNGKVVLVTGASKGIGASVVLHLAAAGAKVVVNYAGSQEDADKTVNDVKSKGGDAIAIKADVSKPDQVKKLFDDAISHYGKIDVLVNNAGIMITKLLKDLTDDDFTKMVEVNIRGTFNTMREAAARLADNGSIINFSSTNNRIIAPHYSVYAATKSAVEQLTRIFSKEVGRGINVNSVSPGPTNTELFTKGKSKELIDWFKSLTAFNRIGEPEDTAKVVVFLASDDAKWISAQNIGINGAMA